MTSQVWQTRVSAGFSARAENPASVQTLIKSGFCGSFPRKGRAGVGERPAGASL